MNPYLKAKADFKHRNPYRMWSQVEVQFLQANLHLSYEDIAIQMLDRTPDAVRQKIWYLKKSGEVGSKWAAKRAYKYANDL